MNSLSIFYHKSNECKRFFVLWKKEEYFDLLRKKIIIKSGDMMKEIIMITGASSGMGREFAMQIEKKYQVDEIWVIARRKERL